MKCRNVKPKPTFSVRWRNTFLGPGQEDKEDVSRGGWQTFLKYSSMLGGILYCEWVPNYPLRFTDVTTRETESDSTPPPLSLNAAADMRSEQATTLLICLWPGGSNLARR